MNMDTPNDLVKYFDEHVSDILSILKKELSKIRAGKADPTMLQGINVLYYGNMTPLSQIAAINIVDIHTIEVKPWEKKMLQEIEKAINMSNLGLTPQNTGETVKIIVPPMSEERRISLVKMAKQEVEKGKVMVRNLRQECREKLKGLQKNGMSEDTVRKIETEIQIATDKYTKVIDNVLVEKERNLIKM